MPYNAPPPLDIDWADNEVRAAAIDMLPPPVAPALPTDAAARKAAPPEGCALGYPDNNPKTAFGVKKLPLHLVPPSAVGHLARAFSDGARKYGPYNWRMHAISSSVYYGAALRHMTAWWDGEDVNPDSGHHHLAHAMACLAMVLDGQALDKLNDDRPPNGTMGEMQARWNQEKGGST